MESLDPKLRLVLTETVGAVKFDGYAIGFQAPTSEPVWAIRRTSFDPSTQVTSIVWADFAKADLVWDNRTSYFGPPPSGSFPAVVVTGDLESTPGGLRNGGRVTIVDLSSGSWTPLPPVPLTNRNAICIQNQSSTEVKLNYAGATGSLSYVGIVIPSDGERFYDITDKIQLFAMPASGTVQVTVEEIS